MQYVGQTCRKLKNRFGEHYRKIKPPQKIDTFLYHHIKRTGHPPDNVLVLSSVTSSGVVKLLPLFRYYCSRIQTCFPDLRKVCIGRYILQCAQGGC